MVPIHSEPLKIDFTEGLDEALEHAWRTLCEYYDAGGELPEMQTLFAGADIYVPRQAAETVIANMILDLAEGISRFSPWYTKPTRAFGISVIRDNVRKSVHCALAPEAAQKWTALIEPLAVSIRQNLGFIKAALYVESLGAENSCGGDFVTASCACLPPRTIRMERSALDKGVIYCDICKHPFT